MTREFAIPSETVPTVIPGCELVAPALEEEFTWSRPDSALSEQDGAELDDAVDRALPDAVELGLPGYWTIDDGHASTFFHVERDAMGGELLVVVGESDEPVPYCVAGQLDSREIRRDGTVIDRQESGREFPAGWNTTRTVTVYRSDGSFVVVSANDQDLDESGVRMTGTVPLSIEELVAIGSAPNVVLPE